MRKANFLFEELFLVLDRTGVTHDGENLGLNQDHHSREVKAHFSCNCSDWNIKLLPIS